MPSSSSSWRLFGPSSAMLKALWTDLGHFLGPKRSKKIHHTRSRNGSRFWNRKIANTGPKNGPQNCIQMFSWRNLGSSRFFFVILGHQHAFFESSGSTMIASSFSRCLFGCFLGSFKALQELYLELFGSIRGLLGLLWGCFRHFIGHPQCSLQALRDCEAF